MAIAFDGATAGTQIGGGTLTFSHTCSGSNLVLFVQACVIHDVSVSSVTGVTYNSVAMTQIGTASSQGSSPGNQSSSLWYLAGPATGANNIVITASNSPFAIVGSSASYTGASQTGIPDNYTVGGSSVNTTDYSLTVTAGSGCWVLLASKNDGGVASAGTGTTSRIASGNGCSMMDSNANVSGSQALHSTFGASVNWNGLIVSFAEVGGGGGSDQPMMRRWGGFGPVPGVGQSSGGGKGWG